MAVFVARHGTTRIDDGTGTPLTVTLTGFKTAVSITGFEEGGKAAVDIKDRGDFVERVYGEENTVAGSAEIFHNGDLTDATTKTFVDALLKQGAWASAVSRDTAAGDNGPMAYKIIFTLTRGSTTNVITCDKARIKADYNSDINGNSIKFSWESPASACTIT